MVRACVLVRACACACVCVRACACVGGCVCVCVGNSVTKSACHLYRIAEDHRGPRGAVVNEDPPGKPVQTYLPFFKSYGNQAKPRTWTQFFFHNLFSIAWPGLSQEPQHTA